MTSSAPPLPALGPAGGGHLTAEGVAREAEGVGGRCWRSGFCKEAVQTLHHDHREAPHALH